MDEHEKRSRAKVQLVKIWTIDDSERSHVHCLDDNRRPPCV